MYSCFSIRHIKFSYFMTLLFGVDCTLKVIVIFCNLTLDFVNYLSIKLGGIVESYARPNIVKQVRALQHNNLEFESALYRWNDKHFFIRSKTTSIEYPDFQSIFSRYIYLSSVADEFLRVFVFSRLRSWPKKRVKPPEWQFQNFE